MIKYNIHLVTATKKIKPKELPQMFKNWKLDFKIYSQFKLLEIIIAEMLMKM
jgi:hypothetical protein